MNKFNPYLITSLLIVVFVLGLMGGYYVSPAYKMTMYENDMMGLGQADRFVDLRYLNAMAQHHRAAMLLVQQVDGRANKSEINNLAKEILANEPKLIEELYDWKKSWYNDGRKVSDPKVVNLGQVDESFELRFLNALIAHHIEGIKMTQEIRLKSSRVEVIDNANAVEDFLSTTLITLKTFRKEWYGIE